MSNPFGYSASVWRLFQQTPQAGAWPAGEAGVRSGQAGTPAGRQVLRLQLKIAEARVREARFQAYGCPTTIAVGAWLAQGAAGRSLAELRAVNAAQIRAALEISEARAHCALLGEDALRAALGDPEAA